MTVAEPAYVGETLAWCNEQRALRGKRPLKRLPKGHRHDPESCPCGKATGLAVYGDSAEDDEGAFAVPASVCEFVDAFDAGELPQYEATRKEPR